MKSSATTTISILCPTIGRTTLRRLCEELLPQLGPHDQFMVIGDGPQPTSRDICTSLPSERLLYTEYGPTGNGGSSQLDYGSLHAIGDFISFIGDDDHVLPGALEYMRSKLRECPFGPHLFPMKYEARSLRGETSAGSCSGQQIVVPNRHDKLAKWTADAGDNSDCAYIRNTRDLWEGVLYMHNDQDVYWLEQRNHGKVF